MNITLVQLALDEASRSVNLQSIMRAVDEACKADPAPDVVVLPGAVDTGGRISPGGYTEAILDGIAGLLSAKAREWGVYVGVGLHRFERSGLRPVSVLMDPDGDPAACDPLDDVGGCVFSSALCTQIGTMIMVHMDRSSTLPPPPQRDAVPLMIVPVAMGTNARARQRVETHIAELKAAPDSPDAYWAVVMPAESARGITAGTSMTTFLRDPGGRILVEADDRSHVKLVTNLDMMM